MTESKTTNQCARTPFLGARSFTGLALALLAGLLLSVGATGLSAQQAQTGTVVGRVQNALNGVFLNNARVTVEGTSREAFTNGFGEFQISSVAAGDVKLTVFYTGMESQTTVVYVPAGQIAYQDFQLKGSGTEDMVLMDEFVIAQQRETNAANIAMNEQRFAVSIKNVVDAGAFGDVTEGNVGEFVKYLPGVTVDYVAADVRTMSVRGFADNFTAISFDGTRLASASSGNAQRAFEFEQVSLNNVARVELTKVPTPEMPFDALGGAVNMITKSAFERDRAQFNFRTYLSINSEDMRFFAKTPGPLEKQSDKVLPGFDFDYSIPVTKKFGLVITGLSSNQFNEQHRVRQVWNFAGGGLTSASSVASPFNPFLQQFVVQDGPKNTYRQSLSVKADWKIARNQLLTVNLQYNNYSSNFGNRNINWEAGALTTTATGTAIPLSWGSTFTTGATGRGSVRHGTSFRDKNGATGIALLNWRYTGRLWSAEAGGGLSSSKSWYRDTEKGHFSEIRTTLGTWAGSTFTPASRVRYVAIGEYRPGIVTAYNAAGVAIDPFVLANYRLDTARRQPVDGKSVNTSIYGKLKRELDFLPFPASVKAGFEIRTQDFDVRKLDEIYTFNGLNGTTNAGFGVDTRYSGQDPYWGLPSTLQWPDPYLLYRTSISNPTTFTQSDSQKYTSYGYKIRNSVYVKETVSSAFLQAEARLLKSRLRLVGGFRFEKTEDVGDGAFTTPLPKANTATQNLALAQVQWRERGKHTEGDYSGYYPSFTASYNITDDLLVRLSYAKVLGRPDFSNIVPRVRYNEDTVIVTDDVGDIAGRTVLANNPELKPWSADSYDVSIEYYMPKGGALSVGAFQKNLTGFFNNTTMDVTQEDIDRFGLPDTLLATGTLPAAKITSLANGGDAKITGVEFAYNQPLKFLPWWFQYLSVNANATKLDLEGDKEADFARFIRESGNFGLTFSKSPVTIMVKWNYRGQQRLTAQTGAQYQIGTVQNGFYSYYAPRTFLDLNMEYKMSKRYTLFFNARNITNKPQDTRVMNVVSAPGTWINNREEYGVQMAIGLKGKF